MSDSIQPTESATSNRKAQPAGGNDRWRLPVLLALVLLVVVPLTNYLVSRLHDRRDTANAPSTAATGIDKTDKSDAAALAVSLTVDFGDGAVRNWNDIAWHDGMTVADVLSAVSKRADNPIEYTQLKSGEKAFLTRIGDKTNEGGGGSNWTYAVNDKRADRSFEIYQLQPGDTVLWRFGPQR